MFRIIKHYRQFKRSERRNDGFNYAAGRILQDPSTETVRKLEMRIETERSFKTFDAFDEGILAAIATFKRTGIYKWKS